MRRNDRDRERIRNRRRNRPPASIPGPHPVQPPPPVPLPIHSPPPAPDPAPVGGGTLAPVAAVAAITLPPQIAAAVGRPTLLVEGSALDLSIIGVIRSTGCYEPHVMVAMVQHLPVGGSFVDVGANIGVLSMLAALRVGEHGKVLAIEASPATYPFLLRNLAKTGRPGVITVNRGAWDQSATLKFCHLPHVTGGSHITTTGNEEGQLYSISCDPLDTLVEASGLDRVDLIKIDVEGSEIRVLLGGRKILSKYRPPIIIEFNRFTLQQHAGEAVQDLYRCLRDSGYGMKILMEDGTVQPVTDFSVMESVSRQWTLRLDVLCEHKGEQR